MIRISAMTSFLGKKNWFYWGLSGKTNTHWFKLILYSVNPDTNKFDTWDNFLKIDQPVSISLQNWAVCQLLITKNPRVAGLAQEEFRK